MIRAVRYWLALRADRARLERLVEAQDRRLAGMRTVVEDTRGRSARLAQRHAALVQVLAEHAARQDDPAVLLGALGAGGFDVELRAAMRRVAASGGGR